MYAPTAWAPAPNPSIGVKSRSTPRGALALVVIVLLACGAVGYAWNAKNNVVPAGTSDYISGKGVVYTPADKSYTAQFPASPTESSQAAPAGNFTLTINLAISSTNDYELGVGEMAFPVAVPTKDANGLLDGALKSGMDNVKGTVQSQQHIQFDGMPAIDAHAKGPDGYGVRLLVVASPRHLYLLMVHSKVGVDKLFDTLSASFVTQDSAV